MTCSLMIGICYLTLAVVHSLLDEGNAHFSMALLYVSLAFFHVAAHSHPNPPDRGSQD